MGITFSTDLHNIPHINYDKALAKAKKVINSWKYRNLTPIGKITVIKTLILSKFVHLFMIIPISNTFLNNIDKILYSFLWAGKPDRVSRKDICKTNLKGGLKMINLCHFEKSLKLSWLKLLTTNYSKDWFSVLQATVGDINKLYRVGIKWTRTLDKDILNSCIWYNNAIENIFPRLVQKGYILCRRYSG